jgi:hypothetical protein
VPRDIDEEIARLQTTEGWTKALSVWEMERAWVTCVGSCERGYDWGIYEFHNDLSMRDRIELVLKREDLRGLAAVEHFRACVQEIDNRFRMLLRSDVTINGHDAPWWRQNPLKYAGEVYAQDVLSLYGVAIEVR